MIILLIAALEIITIISLLGTLYYLIRISQRHRR
jgi:uncharacterized membrane protein